MIKLIKKFYHVQLIIYSILFFIKSTISLNIDDDLIETIKLDNGNLLILTYKENFYLANPNFTTIINTSNYCCFECSDDRKIFYFLKEDGGYILLYNGGILIFF